jgi:hypothetical protein
VRVVSEMLLELVEAEWPSHLRSSAAGSRRAIEELCGRGRLVHIQPQGGSFQMPRCNGWSGTIAYPSTFGPKFRLIITTSTKNSFGEPAPPSGTAIFYIHVQPHDRLGGPAFHNSGVTDTVTSPRLTSDHTLELTRLRGHFPPCGERVHHGKAPEGAPSRVPA